MMMIMMIMIIRVLCLNADSFFYMSGKQSNVLCNIMQLSKTLPGFMS